MTTEATPQTSDSAERPARLVIISAGVSDPSSTRLLADRLAQKTVDLLAEAGRPASVGSTRAQPGRSSVKA